MISKAISNQEGSMGEKSNRRKELQKKTARSYDLTVSSRRGAEDIKGGAEKNLCSKGISFGRLTARPDGG